jgi:XTP/dITP diphosphohydrolase
MTIVLATHSKGKAREFERLFDRSWIEIKTLEDCGVTGVPEECGGSFLANARIKAEAALKATGLPVLADDSGLCVDALGGAPGIHSSAFDIPWLLEQMEGKEDRAARFVCQLVLLYPDGRVVLTEGFCEGEILREERGTEGFGYDPVFFVPEKGRSMAELSPEEKNEVSHRGKALHTMLELLKESWL